MNLFFNYLRVKELGRFRKNQLRFNIEISGIKLRGNLNKILKC